MVVRSTDGSDKSATCVVTVNKKDTPVPGKSSLTEDLKLGSQGTEVQALQQRLAAFGYYNGAIDGDFGRVTDAAVKALQRANGLYVDGVVGPSTRQTLGFAAPSSSQGQKGVPSDVNLVLGSKREAVLSLQQTLRSLGYNVGALDGYFGPVTETAVKAFQRANGLYVDGVVGPYTWAE